MNNLEKNSQLLKCIRHIAELTDTPVFDLLECMHGKIIDSERYSFLIELCDEDTDMLPPSCDGVCACNM